MKHAAMTPSLQQQRGFSLVELMVAVVIGLALTLALTTIMVRYEGGRRVLTSSNDLSLTSAYVSFELDRQLRSAGSGFAQSPEIFGCTLRVARSATQILPRGAAFPAPFDQVNTSPGLVPVLIHAGLGVGGSDVIAVMTGASGLGELGIDVKPLSATSTDLRLRNTVGVSANDLVLVAEQNRGCLMEQVTSPFVGGATELISFGGVYAATDVDGLQLSDFSSSANPSKVWPLGNVVGRAPQLQLLGVGDKSTLFTYDLLRLTGSDAAQPLANGVVDMRALYGVDTDADGRIDSWVPPTAAGYTSANLSDGTAASQDRLKTIMAVRIGLVLRSDRVEKTALSPASIVLFSDLPAAVNYTRTLSATEQLQQFRGVEFTVPLRNVMLSYRSTL